MIPANQAAVQQTQTVPARNEMSAMASQQVAQQQSQNYGDVSPLQVMPDASANQPAPVKGKCERLKDLANLKDGEVTAITGVLTSKEKLTTSTGKPYCLLHLSDKTATDVPVKRWSLEDYEDLCVGTVYQFEITGNEYQHKVQYILNDNAAIIEKDKEKAEDYILSMTPSQAAMDKDFATCLTCLSKDSVKNMVNSLREMEQWQSFTKLPGTTFFTETGGLYDYMIRRLKAAIVLKRVMDFDLDTVMLAIIVSEFGRVAAYSVDDNGAIEFKRMSALGYQEGGIELIVMAQAYGQLDEDTAYAVKYLLSSSSQQYGPLASVEAAVYNGVSTMMQDYGKAYKGCMCLDSGEYKDHFYKM